jgi:hypothetical protein
MNLLKRLWHEENGLFETGTRNYLRGRGVLPLNQYELLIF